MHGYEVVQRPDRAFVRQALSPKGQRKHDRLEALGRLGWTVITTRGAGMVTHPDRSGQYSIAAA
ncbi:MAG: hypothetical protein ACLPV4_21240, partial [Solirubrobacteraceae bacterium]